MHCHFWSKRYIFEYKRLSHEKKQKPANCPCHIKYLIIDEVSIAMSKMIFEHINTISCVGVHLWRDLFRVAELHEIM